MRKSFHHHASGMPKHDYEPPIVKQAHMMRDIAALSNERTRPAGRQDVPSDTNIGWKYEPLNAEIIARRDKFGRPEPVEKMLRRLKQAMAREFGHAGRNAKGIQSGSGFHAHDGRRFEKPSDSARHARKDAQFRNQVALRYED